MKTPKRTCSTGLTGDELLLFDFLFDKSLSFQHLRMENYSLHMNCQYSHGLSDDELKITLNSLIDRGLLRSRIGKVLRKGARAYEDGNLYTITEAGGRLWELERLADWDRFVVSTERALSASLRGVIRIVCRSELVGRLCLGAMFASGSVSPIGPIRARTVWDAKLLPWKVFERVVSVRCQIDARTHGQPMTVHWDVYHASRCWWRDVSELDSLMSMKANMVFIEH
jgi:hypothetical protein